MAARLNTVQDALNFLRWNKIDNFSVRTNADRDTTLIFKTDSEKTPAENLDAFERVADMTIGAFYIVESGARGTHRIEVKNEKTATVPAAPAQVAGIYGEDEIERRVNEKFQAYLQKRENEDMLEELKELRKEVNRRESVGERFMSKLEPYIGTIVPVLINKFMPQTASVAVAGIQQIENENEMNTEEIILTEEQETRITNAIAKWFSADADCLSLLEKIAVIAESNDPMYQVAKNMLINYNK